MFAIVHLEGQIALLLEVVEAEVARGHQDQGHKHKGLLLEGIAEAVEDAEDAESPEAVAEVLETQEQHSVIPIILLDLANVMEMEEPFPNNVMESHTIRTHVIVNKISLCQINILQSILQ